MIKPEQIPDKVAKPIVDHFFQGRDPRGSPDYFDDVKQLIAAALNAWETPMHRAIVGKALDEVGSMYPALILPLNKEPRT